MKHLLIGLFVIAIVLGVGSLYKAQAGGGGHGWYGYGYPYYANLYYPTERRVPYFAEHPPVYYSYPVPRTYGQSPFAYPPTHEASKAEPVTIYNPYVPSTPAKLETEDRATSVKRAPEPLVVINPFVKAEGSVAVRRR